jgi:hypothetical protein
MVTYEYVSSTLQRLAISSPPRNVSYGFRVNSQIYHLISPLCPNEANKPGYRQFYIFDSAEATTDRLENHSNGECMAEVTQRWTEMLP